jgi:Transposase IS66 family
MANNAAERAVRCDAVGRKNWTFAARTRADIAPPPSTRLIETAKLNDSDSQASLADLLTF